MFVSVLHTVYEAIFILVGILFLVGGFLMAISEIRGKKKASKEESGRYTKLYNASEIIQDACEEICDHYCKHRDDLEEDDPRCDDCPLHRII